MPHIWFDAHLDLAYLALLGRDMLAPLESLDPAAPPHPPAAVTLPAMREGGVFACLGTIFTEADGAEEPISYRAGDADGALAAGLRQLSVYQEWKYAGAIRPLDAPDDGPGPRPLRLGILIEGADPIRSPDDVAWWKRWGVVAVGLAWWKPSRYAGGNGTHLGLSDAGRDLVAALDAEGIVHDVSHLSDRALADLYGATDRPVMASHSNCRAHFPPQPGLALQRHLTDEAIREIARRGGMIGLNLYSKFLAPGIAEDGRATVDDCVRHVEHVCEVVGHRRAVGLGSDMDGGFSGARLPAGIDRPRDLDRLADALRARDWCDADIQAFAWGNWARFWNLPCPGQA
jgi:membrane dipeptidase